MFHLQNDAMNADGLDIRLQAREHHQKVARQASPVNGAAGSARVFTAHMEKLSRRRQEIIRPVVESPGEYVLLTVRDMAERLQTDPAMIIRIVRGLGFVDYKSFKQYLHELSRAHMTGLELMQSSLKKDGSIAAHTRASLDQDFKNLNALRQRLDLEQVAGVAKRLWAAKKILLVGGDLATTLVEYLEYQMAILGLPVFTATTAGRTIHIARSFTERDVVIAISFRRGLRQTVEGIKQARASGAYCIGITDTYISPIARFSNEFFLASVETPSFGASYVAPLALLNAILMGAAHSQRKHTLDMLKKADDEQRSGYRWYTD